MDAVIVTEELATEYLKTNKRLHDALGISPTDALALKAVSLKQGEHNANFLFEHPGTHKKQVLRVNYISQLGLDDQIGYEFRALEFLEPSGCTPLPRFLDSSKDFGGHGALVMDFYEGEYMDYLVRNDLAKAASILADIHAVPVPDDGSCPLISPGDPLRAQYEECAGYVNAYRSSALADQRVLDHLDRFMRITQEALDTPFDPAFSNHVQNTEAVQPHFLLPRDGGRGCMVDWEKPIVGEVAQDVAYFLSPTTTIWDTDDNFVFSKDTREWFVETYWNKVDGRFPRGNFDARFDAYVKSNCLRGITWSAATWVEYHDPNRPLKTERTFNKLQTYLDEDFLAACERSCFANR